MKRKLKMLLLIIVMFFSPLIIGGETITRLDIPPSKKVETPDYFSMFMDSYSNLRKWEGNYSYLPDDKGGETYAGISRNYNPNWDGWEILDQYKKDSVVCWNVYIDAIEPCVIDYYFSVWMGDKYYLIKDPIVRDYLFDYRNTGTIAYIHLCKVLNEMGYNVCVSTPLTEDIILVLNTVDQQIFITKLQEERTNFYERVAARYPMLQKYLRGWINRANNISV